MKRKFVVRMFGSFVGFGLLLILLVLWPRLGVLPGTEGMAGYKDARRWTIKQLNVERTEQPLLHISQEKGTIT